MRSNTKKYPPVHPPYKDKTVKGAANTQECVTPTLLAGNTGTTDSIVDGKPNTTVKALMARVKVGYNILNIKSRVSIGYRATFGSLKLIALIISFRARALCH